MHFAFEKNLLIDFFLFITVSEKLIYISLNMGILIKNSFVWHQCILRETRHIDFSSSSTTALNHIISLLPRMIFLPKDGRTSLTSRGYALISLNRLKAVCTWGMLFLFACRLHSTWHEWLHGSRCYIRPPETKVKAKSNSNWKRTVINVSRSDVGNKAAAVVTRAFTLIGKILRLFESQDFSMEKIFYKFL